MTAAILQALVVDVILDDDLHAEPHVVRHRDDREDQDDRDQRMRDDAIASCVGRAGERRDDDHEGDDQRDVRHRRHAVQPPMLDPVPGGAEALARGRAGCAWKRGCRPCCRPWSGLLRQQEGDGPDHDRQRDRADEGEAGHGDALAGLHAMAEIPDQMAHAAEHVVHQRPRCSRTGSAARRASRRTTAPRRRPTGPAASATSQIAKSAMPK